MIRRTRIAGYALLVWAWAAAVALAAPNEQAAWKIGIRKAGLYRLTGADLAKAGMPIETLDARTLKLHCQGREVPIHVSQAAAGRFGPQDFIAFFATGLDTKYTDTNVYWLTFGGTAGRRWAQSLVPLGGTPRTVYRAREHFEENTVYKRQQYVETPGEVPHWFWGEIRAGEARGFTLRLSALPRRARSARLVVALWGNTTLREVNPDHHTLVFLNGHLVEDRKWDGQTPHRIERDIPAAWLREGDNSLAIRAPGDTRAGALDYVLLDWVEVSFDRRLVARNGSLLFEGGAGPQQFRVTGVSPGRPVALDVTRPDAAVRLAASGANGVVSFANAPRKAARYLVASFEGASRPAWVGKDNPSKLRDTAQGADYLIIAHDDLADAVEPLAEWRRKQGMRVVVARVRDVYDEFSHGVVSPWAIRALLTYAYREWRRPAPKYVLLVGDANYDYRDYLRTGRRCFIPAYMVRIRESMETAFDGWYTAVGERDTMPRMAIGRIPASDPDQVATVVRKILAYEQTPAAEWHRRAVVVSDHDREDDLPTPYEQFCDEVIQKHLAGLMDCEFIPMRRNEMVALKGEEERGKWVRANLTPAVVKAIDQGALFVEYFGHGDARCWSRLQLLDQRDVPRLSNDGRWPIFLEMSCFTGWFDNPSLPDGQCLAERLLFHKTGGAIASIAASRLGGSNFDAALWAQWTRGRKVLGDALLAAWESNWPRERGFWPHLANYNLLGDPALRIPLPDPKPRPEEKPAAPPAEAVAQATELMRQHALPPPAQRGGPTRGLRLETGLVETGNWVRPVGEADAGAPPTWADGFYLIQFEAGQGATGEKAVADAGGEVLDRVPEEGIVAFLTRNAVAKVVADRSVHWIGPFRSVYKVSAAVGAATVSFNPMVTVRLRCFRASDRAAVAARLRSVQGESLGMLEAPRDDSLRARLPVGAVYKVAEWPEVRALLPDAPVAAGEKK